MTPPAYHLRTNKAIDRLMFIDALRRMVQPAAFSKYTYFGFGGPYLEDFRLLHESFPELKMISIEQLAQIYKRQAFHRPSSHIKLRCTDLSSFLGFLDIFSGSVAWDLEFARHEIEHGKQVFRGSIAPRFSLGG
jgi:hypothetical protein